MKKKSKPKVKQCPCACVPPPRKRRQTPAYSPRPPPQFYSPLPIPQSEFHADTVKRIVQDEFKRYHSTRPNVIRGEMSTQTETDFPDDISEGSFGMTAALEEMRREGSAFGVRRGEQIAIESQIEQEQLQEREREIELRMEAARAAFKPIPVMAQPEEL